MDNLSRVKKAIAKCNHVDDLRLLANALIVECDKSFDVEFGAFEAATVLSIIEGLEATNG